METRVMDNVYKIKVFDKNYRKHSYNRRHNSFHNQILKTLGRHVVTYMFNDEKKHNIRSIYVYFCTCTFLQLFNQPGAAALY